MKKILPIIFSLLSMNSFSQGFFGSYDYKDPDVRISSISSVTCSSAKVNVYLYSNGGGSALLRLLWNTTNPPFFGGNADIVTTVELNKNYEYEITGLLEDTTYYVMAMAILNSGYNSSITDYSTVSSFTTASYPTVLIAEYPSITGSTYIDSGGAVSDNGGDPPTEFGLCWNSSGNPSLSDNYAVAYIGDETGFISHCTGLSPSTTYYFKAYAINSCGVSYSDQQSYTTSSSNTVPAVATYAASSITMNSAYLSGSVTSDGGASVTSRGFCWNTSGNPSLSDSYSTNGSGTGDFFNSLTGLSYNTTYYVKAYAINSVGTSYGNEINFTTLAECDAPVVLTNSIDTVWTNKVVANITLSDDGGCSTVYGICWDTLTDPTLSDYYEQCGATIGTISCEATGLTSNTTYYLRAYATNSTGTVYGEQLSFTTPSEVYLPTVLTADVTSITYNSAVSGGNVTNQGGSTVTERGIVYGTITKPDIFDTKVTDSSGGLGSYTSNLTGLSPSTTYYVRAYAINSVGVAYGDEYSFITPSTTIPIVTTTDISSITYNSAVSGGNVKSQGGATVTARGVCWNTTGTPTISNRKTTDGSGIGSFTSSLTGLSDDQTYYVRAYATNSAGTSYGSQVSFKTNTISIPSVTTTTASSITTNSASSGGNVTSDGGGTVSARGVVWNRVGNPTVNSYMGKTTDGSGTGSFTSYLTSLSCGYLYYVRAYAINEVGTAYGTQRSFTTPCGLDVTGLSVNATNNPVTATSTVVNGCPTNSIVTRYIYYNTTGVSSDHTYKVYQSNYTGMISTDILMSAGTYYFGAYSETDCGSDYYFWTSPVTIYDVELPTVSTASITDISYTTATGGGYVSDDGGGTVTARGVCWNTTGTPTISNSKTTDGSGTGSFTSSLTGLSDDQTYYVRAYATNSAGTSYGSQVSFTTNSSYIPCDSPKSYPGGISYPTKLYFTLGSSIGTVSFTYNPYSYPDQMIVEIDGVIVLDTGYRGSTTYDYGGLNRSFFTTSLNGKSDPTGGVYPNLTKYTDDGYPRVTYNYNYTTDYFNKVTTYPTAIVKVYAPMPGTAWEFTLGCPQ